MEGIKEFLSNEFAMTAIISCDPRFVDAGEASEVLVNAMISSGTGTPYTYNDIGYAYMPVSDNAVYVISVLDK